MAWAVTAVFLSIVPSYVSTLTGNHNLILAGVSSGLVISAFYVASYLGVGVPVVGVGLLATVTTTTTAVDVFAGIALLGCLVVAGLSYRTFLAELLAQPELEAVTARRVERSQP